MNTSSGMYSKEYLTRDYIDNLYKEANNVIETFNSLKNVSINYSKNVFDVPVLTPTYFDNVIRVK